jgi:hypothetical protein
MNGWSTMHRYDSLSVFLRQTSADDVQSSRTPETTMEFPGHPIEAAARLRPENQLTRPQPIARALDAAPNDVLIFEIDPTEPRVVRVHLMSVSRDQAVAAIEEVERRLEANI